MVLFSEDALLPLSALADLAFCERRAALHHIEGVWADNLFTAEGTILHHRTHEKAATEVRGDLRIARGLQLRSLRLGLSGVADVVEFHKVAPDPPADLSTSGDVEGRALCPPGLDAVRATARVAPLPGVPGLWRPFPVEYKRGRLHHEKGYELQLCAQALCLEEMLGATVESGSIYYGGTKRRLDVAFMPDLRRETEAAAARLHELVRAGITPRARYEKKCERCSLIGLCLPKAVGGRRSARRYLEEALAERASNGGVP